MATAAKVPASVFQIVLRLFFAAASVEGVGVGGCFSVSARSAVVEVSAASGLVRLLVGVSGLWRLRSFSLGGCGISPARALVRESEGRPTRRAQRTPSELPQRSPDLMPSPPATIQTRFFSLARDSSSSGQS